MKRKMALGAAVLALGAGSAALVQKATAGGAVAVRQDAGGLSLMPAVIETNAKTGALATVTVANRSAAPMTVTLTPRQWVQGADGKVSPNRKAALGGVSVDGGRVHARAGRGEADHGQRQLARRGRRSTGRSRPSAFRPMSPSARAWCSATASWGRSASSPPPRRRR